LIEQETAMAIHSLNWTAALAPLAGWPDVAVTRDCRDRASTGTFRRLVSRYLVWRARLETVRILNSVDRATLLDLGINDIESEVYGDPRDRMRGYDPCWWRRK
jgi:uncharacterized protein YjiS (DUF1127 family)